MPQFSRFLIHCLDLLVSTWSNIGPTAELCFRISAEKYFGHNSKEILWTQLERNTVSTFSSYPILSSSESESGLDRRLASFATSTHFEANGRSPSGLVFKTARTKQRICRNQFAELKWEGQALDASSIVWGLKYLILFSCRGNQIQMSLIPIHISRIGEHKELISYFWLALVGSAERESGKKEKWTGGLAG